MSGWVSFDCYGTLVDWEAGMTGALAGLDDIPAVLAAYHEAEPRIEAGPFLRYREVMARALAQAGVAPGMQDAFGRTLPAWPVFADVATTLTRLREDGRRLAILSNVDRDLIAGTLPRLGAEIDLVVTAEDVRSYKPAGGHFDRMREEAGEAPWVHVACSAFHDIPPARAAGARTVWVRRHQPGPAPENADAVVEGIAELPSLVARLTRGA